MPSWAPRQPHTLRTHLRALPAVGLGQGNPPRSQALPWQSTPPRGNGRSSFDALGSRCDFWRTFSTLRYRLERDPAPCRALFEDVACQYRLNLVDAQFLVELL